MTTRPLTVGEMSAFQRDVNYLDMGMNTGSSAVVRWGSMTVLVYRGTTGYFLTNISGLSEEQIRELARTTPAQNVLYFLPQSIAGVIAERAEDVIEIGGSAGQIASKVAIEVGRTVGETLGGALGPTVGSLAIPIIAIGVILAIIYLPQPRRG